MTPYLKAFEVYHQDGEPHIPWIDVLDFHLQNGVVISNRSVFLMARPVDMAGTDESHLSLFMHPHIKRDGWHVWAAVGPIRSLLSIANQYSARKASFQRRNHRLHRADVGTIAGFFRPQRFGNPE